MDPKRLAALVSSLVCQALLLLLSLPRTISALSLPSPSPSPSPLSSPLLLSLLLHLLPSSSSLLASALPRKRKRLPSPPPAGAPRRSPDHFPHSFRMTSATFDWLCGLLDPLLDCRDPAGSSLRLPASTRLAIALSRLATGSPYADLAARYGVPEPAARFCTKHLCRVLCTNFRFWITFPSSPERCAVSTGFLAIGGGGGLDNCCGAVACARFEAFGGSTLVAQIVADSSSGILHFSAGFRGDQPDYRVLKCSSLYKDAQEGRLLGSAQYLVGDARYPLLPWLMVPFANPAPGSAEEDFNAVVRSMCQPARRVACSLRNWGVLSSLMEEGNVKVAVACIATCAILHNVLLMRKDHSALSDLSNEIDMHLEHSGEDLGLEDFVSEGKASTLRNMLAARARAAYGCGPISGS